MVHGVAHDVGGERLDEVLFVVMRGPRSFTGEDVAEIHGHGGVANMARLLRAAVEAGARLAEAGEFTRRAFANQRLDLTRAEAILAVIEAGSERGLRLAQSQLSGQLGSEVSTLRQRGIALLASIEAAIDFPEDDLDELEWRAIREEAASIGGRCEELLGSFSLGRALLSGVTIALTGPVNAGKSSLLNALVGKERALVAEEPGTTRDYVESSSVWSGVPVTLIDTAGERDESEGVESRGIELGRARTAEADLEIAVVPPGAKAPEPSKRRLVVGSKSDLGSAAGVEIETSAKHGIGLDELRRQSLARAIPDERDAEDGAVVTSERQRERLETAKAALSKVAAEAGRSIPPELLAIEMRTANSALADVLGEEIGDEVLDELFARFCIGK